MSQLILILASPKRKRLNRFQLKSLANLCFDLAKILGISPLLKFFEREKIPLDKQDIIVIALVIIVFVTLVFLGLFFARRIKE